MTIIVPVRIRYFDCFERNVHTLKPAETDAARVQGNRALHAFAKDRYPLGAVRYQLENWHEGSLAWHVLAKHNRGLETASIEARKFARFDQGKDRL